ncbi:MAG: transposase family protein [Bacteroidales bacterium]|jgi:transposase|nr:transposase family protein [Bacteroidales bacterium]
MNFSYELLKLVLPIEVLHNFEVVDIHDTSSSIDIRLDEHSNPPRSDSYSYQSKGFTSPTTIQDFPLRGKSVYLHVRKRKWFEKETGKEISNSYDLTHYGTHLSQGFALFFKGTHRRK